MAATVDLALCLRKHDYSETSQILSIFTRNHGLMRVIAKGAKRSTKAGDSRFSGGLDLLEFGEAVFLHWPEKDLSQLTEWTLLDGHLGLRNALRTLYLAQYAAELTSTLLEEHDPHPHTFDDLAEFTAALAGGGRFGPEEAALAFQLRLLESAGILPELSLCTDCRRTADIAFFSPARGGVVCRACEPAHPDRISLDPRLARLAVTVLAAGNPRAGLRIPFPDLRLPKLTRIQTDPLNRVLLAHIAHITTRFPRTGEYLLARTPTPAPPHASDPAEPFLPPLPPRPLDPEQLAEQQRLADELAALAAAPTPTPKKRRPRKPKDIIISPHGDIDALHPPSPPPTSPET